MANRSRHKRPRPTIQWLEPRCLLSVTLTDNGSTVTLANGTVSVTVQKTDGRATVFKLGSSANLLEAGSGKGMYFDSHMGRAGTDVAVGLSGATYSIVTNTSQMVDIALRDVDVGYDATNAPNGLLDITQHYVLRNGDPGFYTYYVFRHNANQPDTYFSNTRQVVRSDPNAFSSNTSGRRAWSYSSPTVTGMSIGSDQLTNEITDQTYELPSNTYYNGPGGGTNYDGNQVWTKYDWSVYQGPTTSIQNTWGVANDTNGVWMISPSNEFNNGGPTKLKPATQGALFITDFDDGHGLGDGIDHNLAAGEVWQKVFGPLFIYANAGANHDALWQDAQNRGAQEVSAWPYSWVNESDALYAHTRGAVTGTITVAGKFAANAEVILGDSGIDWTFQGSKNFLFWTQADGRGQFTIPKVRPGIYTLYAYVPGVKGEWQLSNVTVTANQTTDVGIVDFTPQDRQNLIWQLGTPDRSAAEFRFGDSPRQFGLWWKYLDESGTADRTFVIGQSNPKTDWYYAQPIVALDNGTYFAPKWNIQFNLTQQQLTAMNGSAWITMGLAGSIGTAFYIDVNGTQAMGGSTGQYTPDDSGLNRENTTLSRFTQWEYPLASSLFHTGTNTISIRVRQPGKGSTWTGTRPVLPLGGIQYDFVRLESGPQIFPIGWSNQDVGAPSVAGSASYDGTTSQWTVTGAGSGISGASDQFQFVSHALVGDNTLTAQVLSLNGTSAQAGLIMRQSLAADAPYVAVFVSPGNTVTFQYRSTTGGSTSTTTATSSLPAWLKLQRAGNSFTGFYSTDGVTWTQIGATQSIAMGSSFSAGLAVSSGNPDITATATFGNVSLSDTIGPPTVLSSAFSYDRSPSELSITFTKDISASLAAHDLVLDASSGSISPTSVAWNAATNTATFVFPSLLPDGNYRATLVAGAVFDDLFQPLLSDSTLDFFVLTADATHDRYVNTLDFVELAKNFGKPNASYADGDFNHDAIVNALDFNLLATNFGAYLPSGNLFSDESIGKSLDLLTEPPPPT